MTNERFNRTKDLVPEEEMREEQRIPKAQRVFDDEDFSEDGIEDLSRPETKEDFTKIARDAGKQIDSKDYDKEALIDGILNQDDEDENDNDINSIINDMSKDQQKTQVKKAKKALEEYKETSATRELLFSRPKETIKIPVIINDEDVLTFQARRLTEMETQNLINRDLVGKKPKKMNDDEWEEFMSYNYRLLEDVIVEPHLTQDEWREKVDSPLVVKLAEKVQKLVNDTDDNVVLEDFKKK